jgi:hypothetical protein
MGPQNLRFKRLQAVDFRELLARPGYEDISTYIETGTFWGYQLNFASEVFTSVVGVELDAACVEISRKWNRANPNVQVIHGDSKTQLPVLLGQHPEPCFFFLDAHWCQGPLDEDGDQMQVLQEGATPLWGELEAIRERPSGDILFVDDIHAFGVEPGWEGITIPSVLEFVGRDQYEARKDGLVVWL